jgi:hypothetical protein
VRARRVGVDDFWWVKHASAFCVGTSRPSVFPYSGDKKFKNKNLSPPILASSDAKSCNQRSNVYGNVSVHLLSAWETQGGAARLAGNLARTAMFNVTQNTQFGEILGIVRNIAHSLRHNSLLPHLMREPWQGWLGRRWV